jgi:outer membrane receptor protein involved in Fe transport
MIGDRPLRVQVLFGGPKKLSTENYGFYFQDDWRLSRRLQLNLGARYEYNPPFVGGFNVNTSDPFGSFNAAGTPMFKADRNNLAPRAGLVFDVLGNQKLVLRSGGGVGYLPPQPIFLYDAAFIDPRLPFVTNFAPADVPPGTSSYPFPQSFVAAVVENPSLLPGEFRAGEGSCRLQPS